MNLSKRWFLPEILCPLAANFHSSSYPSNFSFKYLLTDSSALHFQSLTLSLSRDKSKSVFIMASSPVPLSDNTKNKDVYDGDLDPLQKHVAFFDRNKDGIIYPWETYQGFRAIGSGIPLSTFAAIFINVALSAKTRPGKFSLLFPIEVKKIHKGKHGSDSGVYDTEGRFVPEKFEEIFLKYAHTKSNALTEKELSDMLNGNRDPKDYAGWLGSWTEWKILYRMCKDKDGFLSKDTIKDVFDGSLFEKLEESTARKKAAFLDDGLSGGLFPI
ncbi:hypothetical protein NE237_007483 [Protea cynaroides]|uniref:Peroxygenase 4 n=1 Tax=Protea cynaroides TaxID=273540 RepID=A0A9Q0QWJ8_9MAGN|nr:hypothetical protein NE237_007483 [Protea cynaroides]